MKICEKCGTSYEDEFDSCWKCAGNMEPKPEEKGAKNYKRCMACGSEALAEAFLRSSPSFGDGKVEIISKEKDTGLTFLPPRTASSVNGVVCGDCGFIALFADNQKAIFNAYSGKK